MLNSKIVIDEGKHNSISQAFTLLDIKVMGSFLKEHNTQNRIDSILLNFVLRISNFEQMNAVWNKDEWESED